MLPGEPASDFHNGSSVDVYVAAKLLFHRIQCNIPGLRVVYSEIVETDIALVEVDEFRLDVRFLQQSGRRISYNPW